MSPIDFFATLNLLSLSKSYFYKSTQVICLLHLSTTTTCCLLSLFVVTVLVVLWFYQKYYIPCFLFCPGLSIVVVCDTFVKFFIGIIYAMLFNNPILLFVNYLLLLFLCFICVYSLFVVERSSEYFNVFSQLNLISLLLIVVKSLSFHRQLK